MPNAPTTNSRLAGLDRLGEAIDLKTKTEGTESEFGETVDSESTQTVNAIVPTPSRSRDAAFYGIADTDLDIEFIIDGSIDVSDGGGRLASEIDKDQDGTFEYVVLTAVDTQNGLQRLACTEATDV